MPKQPKQKRSWLLAVLVLASSVVVGSASCGSHEGKLGPLNAAGASSGGAEDDPIASSGAGGGGMPPTDDVESPGAAGAGGSPVDPMGSGGALPLPAACIYQLDVPSQALGGAGGGGAVGAEADEGSVGGQGGAGGQADKPPSPSISKATNRLIGDYLTDAAGRSLYVFGADSVGDCTASPISGCAGDCLLSWPIFHVDQRVLAAGLEPAGFGSFTRADGQSQTTYYGWPLYYYANDAKAGDVTGHGVGVWGLAELILPNVVVRRVGDDRLLADGAGRTLYAFAEDTLGTATSAPQSACSDACGEAHPPFSPSYVGAISTLEPRDFTSFVRADGTNQVAYRGAPLYYSLLDGRPGAVNGAEDESFTIVLK